MKRMCGKQVLRTRVVGALATEVLGWLMGAGVVQGLAGFEAYTKLALL